MRCSAQHFTRGSGGKGRKGDYHGKKTRGEEEEGEEKCCLLDGAATREKAEAFPPNLGIDEDNLVTRGTAANWGRTSFIKTGGAAKSSRGVSGTRRPGKGRGENFQCKTGHPNPLRRWGFWHGRTIATQKKLLNHVGGEKRKTNSRSANSAASGFRKEQGGG